MQRWRSEPLSVPIEVPRIAVAQLEFLGVRHDGPSFTVYAFLDAPVDLPLDADRDHPDFAAGFTVFAHGDCWGGEGHCAMHRGPVSAFDRRSESKLRPQTYTLDVTEALLRRGGVDAVTVTILAAELGEGDRDDVLRFERLALNTYTRVGIAQ